MEKKDFQAEEECSAVPCRAVPIHADLSRRIPQNTAKKGILSEFVRDLNLHQNHEKILFIIMSPFPEKKKTQLSKKSHRAETYPFAGRWSFNSPPSAEEESQNWMQVNPNAIGRQTKQFDVASILQS